MAARVSALEKRVEAAENVQQLERLFRGYGYYFDKGLWRETTTLFTDDAKVEIAQRGIYTGRAGVERLYIDVFGRGKECLPPNGLNNHLILQPIFTVAADGSASTSPRNLVEAGNRARHRREGLTNCRFQEGDACDLRDSPTTASTSSSASSAPCSRPSRSTSPRRWCASPAPAARIVMGNWIPNDPTLVAQILRSAPPIRRRRPKASSAR